MSQNVGARQGTSGFKILKRIKVLEQRFYLTRWESLSQWTIRDARPYEYDGSLPPRTTCSFITVVGQFITSSLFSLKGTS
jgi:hypothetical protein